MKYMGREPRSEALAQWKATRSIPIKEKPIDVTLSFCYVVFIAFACHHVFLLFPDILKEGALQNYLSVLIG
jgi:hypothetical protein